VHALAPSRAARAQRAAATEADGRSRGVVIGLRSSGRAAWAAKTSGVRRLSMRPSSPRTASC
jgi:hypothetical protein